MRVKEMQERLLEAGRRTGFQIGYYGAIGEMALPVLSRSPAQPSLRVYISTGMHGDEPAGPLAVLDLLRRRTLPEDIAVDIVPLLNPTGLEKKTRENAEGVDVNRDYNAVPRTAEARQHMAWLAGRQWDLALCLHEDYEATGFYVYEVKPEAAASQALAVLNAVRELLPIETNPEVDGMPNENGLMRPPLERLKQDRRDLPEALWLAFHHVPWCYTFETPSGRYIDKRVRAQTRAVETIIGRFRETPQPS